MTERRVPRGVPFIFGTCMTGNHYACVGSLPLPDLVKKDAGGNVIETIEVDRRRNCDCECHR